MKYILILLVCSLAFPRFKVDKPQSAITYTGSHSFHDWQGTTSEIEIITNCDSMNSNCDATITVPAMSFTSGNDNRDSNMLFYIDAFSYPMIKISFSHLNIYNLLSSDTIITTNGEIDFHGFKINQEIPLFITKETNTISISSSFSIKLDSFQVNRPSLLMLPIKNLIKLDVTIKGEFIP